MSNRWVIFFLLIFVSCLGMKGTFAYRTYQHETYVKMSDGMEIPEGETFDWVYRTDSFWGDGTVGIVLQEKQIVWVDIAINRQKVDKLTPHVYGSVGLLTPGEYKIVLVDKKKLIDEISFTVYPVSPDEY